MTARINPRFFGELMKTELILATFDQTFNDKLEATGRDVILTRSAGSYGQIYDPTMLMMGSRHTLDKNPAFTHIRQLIPYVIIKCGDDIAVYSRTALSTESRLHDKLSIGFGGHIDLDDIIVQSESFSHIDVRQTVINSCYRELHEELDLGIDNVVYPPHDCQAHTGIETHLNIISKEDAVGTVHLGLVYIVEVEDRTKLTIEPELNFVGWYTEAYIRANLELEFSGLEGWSKAVFAGTHSLNQVPSLPFPG